MTVAEDTGVAPVEVTIVIDRPVAAVFELFTARIAEWWPLASHSVAEAEAVTCVLESGVGGRIFERDRNGAEHDWGRITLWEPPARIAFTWHPGRGPEAATRVSVAFDPEDRHRCRVTLTHDGWAVHGPDALLVRQRYDQGWRALLDRNFAGFACAAG